MKPKRNAMNILLRSLPAKKTFANADSTEDASLGLAELALELERLVSRFRYRCDTTWRTAKSLISASTTTPSRG